jgi:hypothetical protein
MNSISYFFNSHLFTLPAIANIVITPVGGTYSVDQLVSLSCATPGVTIRYTVSEAPGTAIHPTESYGTIYTAPFTISSSSAINVIGYKDGMVSATLYAYLNIWYPVAPPVFTPVAGTYLTSQSVTIATATVGATIRYTTDGSIPSPTNGTVYSGAIVISSTTTLKAIAYKSLMTDSTVTSSVLTIQPATVSQSWACNLTGKNIAVTMNTLYPNNDLIQTKSIAASGNRSGTINICTPYKLSFSVTNNMGATKTMEVYVGGNFIGGQPVLAGTNAVPAMSTVYTGAIELVFY